MQPPRESANRLLAALAAAWGKGDWAAGDHVADQLLALSPRNGTELFLLSDAAVRFGRVEQLIAILTPSDPKSLPLNVALANLYRSDGSLSKARRCAEGALTADPEDPIANCLLGQILVAEGLATLALPHLQKAVERAPHVAFFHEALGMAFYSVGALSVAANELLLALQLAPKLPTALSSLGMVIRSMGQPSKAIPWLLQAAEISPSAELFYDIACAYSEDRRHAEGEPYLRKALELDPRHAKAREALGVRLQQLGRFEEAEENLRRALEICPDQASAYYLIVQGRRITESDRTLVQTMEELLGSTKDAEDQRHLHYALGKAYDNLGGFEKAMAHFTGANRVSKELYAKGRAFSCSGQAELFDRLIATFTPEFFERHRLGAEDDRPIFLVGMMRSGTTLVEQVQASHRDVLAGGEIVFWTSPEALKLTEAIAADRMDPVALGRLADHYRSKLTYLSSVAPKITDKMPLNFASLGLIRLLFPKAKVIHCRRDPLDTCLSLFTTPLRGAAFLYEPKSIVCAYREYQRLMDHWRRVLPPDFLFELDYERLVTEPEPVIREMVAFCGLEWDEACLHPEQSPGDVTTPSRWQSRQPIYSGSVGRWRNYEPYLGEFRELLPKQ